MLMAGAMIALSLTGQTGIAQAADRISSPVPSSCGALVPKTVDQTNGQYALAKKALASYCAAQSSFSPRGTNYGTSIRLKTAATIRTCTCGSKYKSWSVDANATGVYYDGSHLSELVLLWRTNPGAAWNNTTRPVDTYNTIPTQSGTMSTSSTIYAVSTLYNYWGTILDQVYSQQY